MKQAWIARTVIALFILMLLFVVYQFRMQAYLLFFIVFILVLYGVFTEERGSGHEKDDLTINGILNTGLADTPRAKCLVYDGGHLDFSNNFVANVLAKRLPYYSHLTFEEKSRFISRTQEFMASKIFKIHDKQGYQEMPILISAAAVQLSFGLKNYLLPQFEYINIYPEEFLRFRDGIYFLEGNVSGNTINISWKHFLEGFAVPGDGQNVGLHEMAHAYYYQNFVVEEDEDKSFVKGFPGFNSFANKAFEQEKTPGFDLYSDYALKNFQEFWAESIEIFFEKPDHLSRNYPELYNALKDLLCQDPLNKTASMKG